MDGMARVLNYSKLIFHFPIGPIFLKKSCKAMATPFRVRVVKLSSPRSLCTLGFMPSLVFKWGQSGNKSTAPTCEPECSDASPPVTQPSNIETVLKQADLLYKEGKYQEILDLLDPFEATRNAEVLWRMSRCLYILSLQSTSQNEHMQLVEEGYELLSSALEVDDSNSSVHKWFSILLDAKVAQEGPMARFSVQKTVKEHMVKATELDPGDSSTLHMLGNWCFNMSEVTWYRRALRKLLTTTYTTSTYEEALKYFLKAEEKNLQFHSNNLLMLGMTYLKLQQPELARRYLVQASEYPAQSDEDRAVSKHASELLRQMAKITDNSLPTLAAL